MALGTNLIAWWKMNEASGNRSDLVGSHTLTDVNTVGSATGKIDNGADFELSNSEYMYNTSTDFHITGANPFSISLWFKAESLPGSGTTGVFISNKKNNNSVGDCFKMMISSSTDGNEIFCQTWASGGGFLTLDTGVAVSTGTWYHLVFVKANASDWKVYVNNSLVAQSTSTRSNSSTALNGISIGAEDQEASGVSQYFDGVIDELGIWTKALDTTEIAQLYNSGTGITYPPATVVTPAAQVVTSSLPSRTIKTGNRRTPSAQVVTASLPTRTISIDKIVSPSAQIGTFSIPAYFVLAGDILVQAAAQVVTASIPTYSVLLDRVFGVNAQVATFSLPSRTISIKETLTPAAQVATFSIPAYTVEFGKTIAVGVQTATFSIPAYSVIAETVVHPSAQVATFSLPARSITLGILMMPLTQVLTFTLPTLYKVGAIWTKIARSTNANWSRTSRNSN